MFTIFITLTILTGLFWLGLQITGALLAASILLFIKLPIALILAALGLALCITIFLIPLGLMCFKWALGVLI